MALVFSSSQQSSISQACRHPIPQCEFCLLLFHLSSHPKTIAHFVFVHPTPPDPNPDAATRYHMHEDNNAVSAAWKACKRRSK